jgi:hypothetical protein
LKDHIYVFDSVTMEKLVTLNTYPNVSNSMGVVALGSRWIAYPGNQVISGRNITNNQISASDKIVEVAKDVAKDLASGLYYFGKKTFQDYIYNDQNTNNTSNSQDTPEAYTSEYAGTVFKKLDLL